MTTASTAPTTQRGLREAMRAFTRVTGPMSRPLAGRRFFKLWGIVHHVGRRSGRAYAVPVAIRTTEDGFVIPLPWGERTQWARNVLEAGGCLVRWNGADHRLVQPRIIGPEEAEPAFSPLLRFGARALGIRAFLRLNRAPPTPRTDG